MYSKERGIEYLGLTVRTYNALRRAGINSLNALVDLKPEQIDGIRNLGPVGRDEICSKLESYLTANPGVMRYEDSSGID